MKDNNSLWLLVLVIIVFSIYFILNSGSELFSVYLYDDVGNVVHSQSIQKTHGFGLVQSFMGKEYKLDETLMQATYEASKNETLSKFRIIIENPFDINAELKFVDIYKNSELLFRHTSNKFMGPNEEFLYKSDTVDLTGDKTKKNKILVKFIFEDLNGNQKIIDYVYEYLYLVRCISDSDCKDVQDVCDVDNVAKLSTNLDKSFCTKLCDEHKDCFEGQLCIQGYCGY
jgi:hypothetical protein